MRRLLVLLLAGALLTVSLGVQTRAGRATDALADNNRRAQALLDVLGQRGVATEDRQTSQVSVQQSYDNRGRSTGSWSTTW